MSIGDKRSPVICCCKEANKNCYLTCPKGRKINPARVYNIPTWPRRRAA